jgi:hypothetical protein
VESWEALVGKSAADVSKEEAAPGFSVEERLVFRSRELEVAVDIASFAESQVQDLLPGIVRNGSKHLRIEK